MSYAEVASRSPDSNSVKTKIFIGEFMKGKISSKTCKSCNEKPLPEEDLCFSCYNNQEKMCKNFSKCKGFFVKGKDFCRKCLSKCPVDGCENSRVMKNKNEFYPTCFKCLTKCIVKGCENSRAKVENDDPEGPVGPVGPAVYHKKCLDCFSKCSNHGCVNPKAEADNGFIHSTCHECFIKDKVICECGKKSRGFYYTEDGTKTRYPTCFDCASPISLSVAVPVETSA